ncbi:MAG TPA: TonB-dependent receptor, partial [Blastocatellia bacterium]
MSASVFPLLRTLGLISFLSCLALAAAGPGAMLHGEVLDGSGAAVSESAIRISSREGFVESEASAADGSYSFTKLQPGQYLVEVKADGFMREVREINLGPDEDKALDIVLSTVGVDEEVVVTGAGTVETIDESSKALTIVDANNIEQRHEYSFIEALRDVPGLRVEQLGGPGNFSKIFIDGLRVVDTSVLFDGFRVRDAADTQGSINEFLQDMMAINVGRIEVLNGSGSSLYGTNAVGGVINIIPVEGSGPPKFDVGEEGGSLGLIREHAQMSGGLGSNFAYSVAGNRLDVNDGVNGTDIYRNTSVASHTRYNITPSISIRANFNFTDGFNRLDNSPFPIGPPGSPLGYTTGNGPIAGFEQDEPDPDSYRFAKMFVGSIALSDQVSSFYNYTVSFQSVDTAQHFADGPVLSAINAQLGIPDFPGITNLDGHIDTFNVTNNIAAGRLNLITGGIEYERESFTQNDSGSFFSPTTNDRQSSFAVFGQDRLSLIQGRLQLLAAFRTEGFMLSNPETVPRLANVPEKRALTADGSIAYRFGSGTKLRSHVGNSFREPSLSERFQIFENRLIGDPLLQPERAISVDAGIDQELFKGKARVSATYFYTRLQQVITETELFMETNSKGALSRGMDISVQATPGRGTALYSTYTFTNSETALPNATLLEDGTTLPAGASLQSFSIPRQQFTLGINQRVWRSISANFNLYSTSSHVFPLFDPIFFNEYIFRFKGYTRPDIGLSYLRPLSETKQMTFYIKVDNFIGERIYNEGFLAPRATALAGVK